MLNRSPRTHFSAIFLAFSLSLISFGLAAQTDAKKAMSENVPVLLVKANEAYAAKDYVAFRDTMKQINKVRPYNGDYMYQLVIAHALLDEKRDAYDIMLHMQQQGLAYDFSKVDSTMNIRGTEVFDYVNDMMIMAAATVGESETVFTLPASVLLPETIAWDKSRQKFLIGTVTTGSILAVGRDGQIAELLKSDAENGMWAVIDILVDEPRKRLWVTSAATKGFASLDPAEKGRSALFEYNLESLELIQSYPVPVDGRPHSLGSMVLSPNGDIYIADRILPIIFSKPANGKQLKAVVASREMVSMRGMAMQPDGRIMYVADRELGILVIDIEAGRAGKLKVPDTLNIGGIDGLYLWNNHLVMIQNGIKPQRVMRLELDATGTQVAQVRPLAVAQSEFDFPNYGVIVGEDIIYFANRQWGNSQSDLKPVTVLTTPLNSSRDLEKPDMQEYLRQRGEKLQAKQKQTKQKQN
jgi:sugar lactone lactonase YvrE